MVLPNRCARFLYFSCISPAATLLGPAHHPISHFVVVALVLPAGPKMGCRITVTNHEQMNQHINFLYLYLHVHVYVYVCVCSSLYSIHI